MNEKKAPLISDLYQRVIPVAFEFNKAMVPDDMTPRLSADAEEQAEDMATKDMDEDWDVKGYMTVWKYEDLVGDVIDEKACDEWMKNYFAMGMKNEYGKPLPMLFEHSMSDPIGYWTKFEKDEMGLMGFAKFYDTQRAKDIQTILKDENNSIGGFSIRFSSDSYEDIEEDGQFKGYLYKKISLKETSLVMRPAQKMAQVTTVKADQASTGTINLAYVTKTLREAGMDKTKANHFVKQLRDLIEPPLETEEDLAKAMEELKAHNEAEEILLALKQL